MIGSEPLKRKQFLAFAPTENVGGCLGRGETEGPVGARVAESGSAAPWYSTQIVFRGAGVAGAGLC